MKTVRYYLFNPTMMFIVLLLVLAILDNLEVIPHLAVTTLACLGAALLVLWTRYSLKRHRSFPYQKLFDVLDDEIFARREGEYHSGIAHTGEAPFCNAEAEALERVKKRLLREFKEAP